MFEKFRAAKVYCFAAGFLDYCFGFLDYCFDMSSGIKKCSGTAHNRTGALNLLSGFYPKATVVSSSHFFTNLQTFSVDPLRSFNKYKPLGASMGKVVALVFFSVIWLIKRPS